MAKIRMRDSNNLLFGPTKLGELMCDERQQKKLDRTRLINRLVFCMCIGAAIIAGAYLIGFRISGHLQPSEFSTARILFQIFMIGVALPVCITTAFYLSALQGSKSWFERLGALFIFVILPAMTLLAIFQWITN